VSVSVVAAQRVMAGVGACLLLGGALAACTAGTPAPAPTFTVDGPDMTTVPEGGAAVTADRLGLPPRSEDEVSRMQVRDAEGLFWNGSQETGQLTRKGQRYRIAGRCLPATTGGRLVVDVLGPPEGGAVDGAPSEPMSGDPVATITVPCDGTEASLVLDTLPASSGALMVAEATRQVSVGWVVLTRIA
jgi:hypothetical protein